MRIATEGSKIVCSLFEVRIAAFASAIVLFAGCGGPGVVLTPQGPVLHSPPPNPLGTYRVVHSFGGPGDGITPMSDLTSLNGTLYGTTFEGGAAFYGTVFEVTPSGAERVVYSFGSRAKDGILPAAGLTAMNGTLYGTTTEGGITSESLGGFGTMFEVTTSGSERVLHSFGLGIDGANAETDLTDVNGTLYGTTNWGGIYNDGIAFRQSASGSEQVLHSFGGEGDGTSPSSLTELDGRLFGTLGFAKGCGVGAVFEMTLSGGERLQHKFCGGVDGRYPSSLIVLDGALYGTTLAGGGKGEGLGTVFESQPSGAERVVYRFQGGTDGSLPSSRLLAVNGVLYGTTQYGGTGKCVSGWNLWNGCGTVFEVTTSGAERVLHSFNGPDGAYPSAGLIDVDGTLYGTTQNGGKYGNGSVFALSL